MSSANLPIGSANQNYYYTAMSPLSSVEQLGEKMNEKALGEETRKSIRCKKSNFSHSLCRPSLKGMTAQSDLYLQLRAKGDTS